MVVWEWLLGFGIGWLKGWTTRIYHTWTSKARSRLHQTAYLVSFLPRHDACHRTVKVQKHSKLLVFLHTHTQMLCQITLPWNLWTDWPQTHLARIFLHGGCVNLHDVSSAGFNQTHSQWPEATFQFCLRKRQSECVGIIFRANVFGKWYHTNYIDSCIFGFIQYSFELFSLTRVPFLVQL